MQLYCCRALALRLRVTAGLPFREALDCDAAELKENPIQRWHYGNLPVLPSTFIHPELRLIKHRKAHFHNTLCKLIYRLPFTLYIGLTPRPRGAPAPIALICPSY
jgi:hypothetical protein